MSDGILLSNNRMSIVRISTDGITGEINYLQKATELPITYLDYFTMSTNILPENTKFFNNLGNYSNYIIEIKPHLRTIKLSKDILCYEKDQLSSIDFSYLTNGFKTMETGNVLLSLPFTIFLFSISNRDKRLYKKPRLFFRLSPLNSIKDSILIPPLPNVATDFSICVGNSLDEINNDSIEEYISVSDFINSSVSAFWKSLFTFELYGNIMEYKKFGSVFSSFLKWQYYSRVDPLFIFREKWLNCPVNLDIKSNISSDFNLIDSISEIIENPMLLKNNNLKKYPLYDISLDLSTILTVNDEFIYKDKKCIVNSMYSTGDGKEYIILANLENQELYEVALTGVEKLEILKNLKKDDSYIESITIGDKEIKEGNFIIDSTNRGLRFNKINKIRKSSIGALEVKFLDSLSNDFYHIVTPEILKNIITSVDLNDLCNKEFYISYFTNNNPPIYRPCKFKKMSNDILYFDILDHSGKNLEVHTYIDENKIIDKTWLLQNKYEKIDYANRGSHLFISGKEVDFWRDKNSNFIGIKYEKEYNDYNISDFVKDNKSIVKYSNSNNFICIGDSVAYISGYYNNTTIHICKVIDFIYSDKSIKLKLVKEKTFDSNLNDIPLTTQNEELIIKIGDLVGFGDFSLCNNTMLKIETKFNDLSSGDKIIANHTGIKKFPKCNVTDILYFIYDGIESNDLSVLCGNGYKIKYSFLINNFSIIGKNNINFDKPKFNLKYKKRSDAIAFTRYNIY